MLQKRLVGVLIIKDGLVVQSINFKRYLPVGDPSIAVDYLNRWGIDEIVLLDIDATPKLKKPDHEKVKEYARYARIPFTVGGGVNDVVDMEKLIQAGADKITINTAAVNNPSLIEKGASLFGNQCIVVSIDAARTLDKGYKVFTHSGSQEARYSPTELAKKAEDHGAGEILLNSIDRDGSKLGYDLELIEQTVNAVKIPVVVCGGVNHPKHFLETLQFNVSGVAAANFFHYSEQSVIVAKSFLRSVGTQIRLDTYATYFGFSFDDLGRVKKLNDDYLEKLRFEYTPEETI